MAINPQVNTILGSYNAMVPKEGPKVVPVMAQLQANNSVLIDLTQLQQQGKISFIQGVMIDNSQSTQALTLTSQAFNQNIVIPAGAQAILPVFVINPPVFIVTSTGGKNIPLFFFNIPLPAQVWNQGAAGFTFNGSALIVTDPALEALIANLGGGNGLAVNVVSTTPTPSVNVGLILTGNTLGNTTITSAAAGAANHWYVTGWELSSSGDAIMAVAGEETLSLTWGGGTAFETVISWYPTATPANTNNVDLLTTQQPNIPYRSAALNDTVKLVLTGAALTGGHFSYNVWGYAAP